VAVDEHRRRFAPVGGADLSHHEWECLRLDQLGVAPGVADEIAHPLGRAAYIVLALRVSADALDPKQLGKLLQPGSV
jgi:hypothetical protein